MRRFFILFIVAQALAGLVGVASMGLAAGANTPVAALKTFLRAIVKGDLATARSVSGSNAQLDLRDPKSDTFQSLKVAAMSFKSVTNVRIKGNKASALAHFDPYRITALFYERIKHTFKTEKQGRQFRARMLAAAKKKLSTIKVIFFKRGGGWKVMGIIMR